MSTTEVATRSGDSVDGGLFDAGPDQMLIVAAKVATQFADIVKTQGMSRRIGQSDHISNSAWQTIGAMTGVFIIDQGAAVTELPWPAIADPDGGWPTEMRDRLIQLKNARALGRSFGFKASFAVHRNGLIMGWAEASCDRNEDNWLAKPDFQLRSQAQTRAQSRALGMPLRWTVKLAGYEPTPAEEMEGATDGAAPTVVAGSPWGEVTEETADLEQAAKIVQILAGDTPVDSAKFVLLMGQAFDGIPVACMKMLRGLARYITDARAATAPQDPPPTEGE